VSDNHCKFVPPQGYRTMINLTIQSLDKVDVEVIQNFLQQRFKVVDIGIVHENKIVERDLDAKPLHEVYAEYHKSFESDIAKLENDRVDLDAEEVDEEAVKARRDRPTYSENMKDLGYDDDSVNDRIATEGRRRAAHREVNIQAEPDPEVADALNNHGQPEIEEDTTFGNDVLYCYQNGNLVDHTVRTPVMSEQQWEQEKARFHQKYNPTHPDFLK